MVTFPNLPTIGASQVTNAGATSNDADAAAVNGFANPRAETVDNTNAFTITNAAADYLWERNISWRFTDDASAPTAQITLTVPTTPARGLFGVINATGQDMQVETSAQVLTAPVIAAGDAALLSNDGTNVELLSSGAGVATFLGLTDTPASFSGQGSKAVAVNAGGTALEFTDFPASAGDALPFVLSPKWRGAVVYDATGETGVNLNVLKIKMDTVLTDTDSIFDNGNDRLVVPTGVTKVRISSQLAVGNAGIDGDLYPQIRKNGSAISGLDPSVRSERSQGGTTSILQVFTPVIDVVENDYFEMFGFVSADSSVDILANKNWLSMEIVETTDTVPSLRTVVASLPAKMRYARIGKTAAQTSIGTAVVEVTFDETQADTDGIADLANEALVVPAGVAKVRLRAQAHIVNGATVGGAFLDFRKNDAVLDPRGHVRFQRDEIAADSAIEIFSPILDVVQGDSFTLNIQITVDATTDVTDQTWFEMEIVEFNSSTDAVQAYIAVPPEHKGALLSINAGQSTASGVAEDIVWTTADEDTGFNPGDGGPAQRFWLGANWTFVDGDVTTGTDQIAETAHGYQTGEGPVRLTNSGGALPTGLAVNTNYWIIRVDANNLKFASSRANAIVGTAVDITAAAGGGTHTVDQEEYIVIPAGVARVDIATQIDWSPGVVGLRTVNLSRRDASGASVSTKGIGGHNYLPSNSSVAGVVTVPGLAVSEGDRFAVVVTQTQGTVLDVDATASTWFSIRVVEESRAITYPGVTVTPPWRGATTSLASNEIGVDPTTQKSPTWDQEVEDTDDFWEGVTNPSRLTIPTGLGIRRSTVQAFLRVENRTAGNDVLIRINKNGTTAAQKRIAGPVDSTTTVLNLVLENQSVVDGDYFETTFEHSGADTAVDFATDSFFRLSVTETDGNAFPPEPVESFINGTPGTSDLIYQKVAARRFTLSDDFAGSEAYFETAPSSAVVFDVDRNGTKIGEILFAASTKTATFTTTAATTEIFDVGDRLSINSPANLFSAADLSIALWAWRS